jgi:hypothetical protein
MGKSFLKTGGCQIANTIECSCFVLNTDDVIGEQGFGLIVGPAKCGVLV